MELTFKCSLHVTYPTLVEKRDKMSVTDAIKKMKARSLERWGMLFRIAWLRSCSLIRSHLSRDLTEVQ